MFHWSAWPSLCRRCQPCRPQFRLPRTAARRGTHRAPRRTAESSHAVIVEFTEELLRCCDVLYRYSSNRVYYYNHLLHELTYHTDKREHENAGNPRSHAVYGIPAGGFTSLERRPGTTSTSGFRTQRLRCAGKTNYSTPYETS